MDVQNLSKDATSSKSFKYVPQGRVLETRNFVLRNLEDIRPLFSYFYKLTIMILKLYVSRSDKKLSATK